MNRMETSLGAIVDNFDSVRVPVAAARRTSGPYPYYGASGVVDSVDGFLFDGEYLLIAEDGENLRTRSTPVAFLANGKFWVNNHAHVVRGRPGLSDTRFLSYLLALTDISGYLTGSTQPKLSQASMNSIQLSLPPLAEQQAIAEVLGALDDKIAANTALLGTTARLRATHVARITDRTGQPQALSDLTELVSRGRAPRYTEEPSDQWVINQKCVRDGRVTLDSARHTSRREQLERRLRASDVLVNSTGMGTLGRVGIWNTDDDATVDSHVTIVRFPEGSSRWCRAEQLVAAQAEIEALGEGSTGQTELSRALLAQVQLAPLNAQADQIEALLADIHAMERATLAESRTLAELRDALLPALIDGTIKVKDAAASAEEVL